LGVVEPGGPSGNELLKCLGAVTFDEDRDELHRPGALELNGRLADGRLHDPRVDLIESPLESRSHPLQHNVEIHTVLRCHANLLGASQRTE
jgi:hypothetical protein